MKISKTCTISNMADSNYETFNCEWEWCKLNSYVSALFCVSLCYCREYTNFYTLRQRPQVVNSQPARRMETFIQFKQIRCWNMR